MVLHSVSDNVLWFIYLLLVDAACWLLCLLCFLQVSLNNKLVAYAEDTIGNEIYTVYGIDADSQALVGKPLVKRWFITWFFNDGWYIFFCDRRHTCLSKASSTVNGSTTNSRLRTATPSSWMRSKLQFLVVETSKKSYWLRLELNTMLIHCPCNDWLV